jgi:hypothetical protein
MKKTIIFLLVVLPLLIYSQITFEKTIGGDLNDYGNAILQTEEGGYIIVGNTYSFGALESDIYIVKTTEYGDTSWTKTYGNSAADYGNDIIETGDGCYIIVGITETYDDLYSAAYLMKIGENGDSLWTKSYWKGSYCRALDIQKTKDGGYIVVGSLQTGSPYTNNFFLLKTDSLGDSTWTRTYGGDEADRAAAVQQTSDGGYIIAGYTESFGADSEDIYIVKTDSNGVIMWDETYGGAGSDYGTGILNAPEDGFIIVGYTDSYGAGYDDCYLLRINNSGDSLWAKTFGGWSHDKAKAICMTDDGGYILVGNTNTYATDVHGYESYVIKTDGNGDSSWVRVYGGNSIDNFLDVIQTSDNGYIAVGFTSSFGLGSSKVYLVKMDENGMVTNITNPKTRKHLSYTLNQNFPNPFNPSSTITFKIPKSEIVNLSVYNVSGQKIKTLVNEQKSAGSHTVLWNGIDSYNNRVVSGVYFYSIQAGEFYEVRKMILLK